MLKELKVTSLIKRDRYSENDIKFATTEDSVRNIQTLKDNPKTEEHRGIFDQSTTLLTVISLPLAFNSSHYSSQT